MIIKDDDQTTVYTVKEKLLNVLNILERSTKQNGTYTDEVRNHIQGNRDVINRAGSTSTG